MSLQLRASRKVVTVTIKPHCEVCFSCRHLAIVVAVDLSQPDEMIATVDTLIENIRERIETLLSRDNSYIMKESMRQKSRQRFGEAHEDASDINPFLVPLLVVGTKYDIFQVLLAHTFMQLHEFCNGVTLFLVIGDRYWKQRKRKRFLVISDW